MSPEATRDSATAPGSMRPERPALPQITVPIGKPPAEPGPAASAAQRPGGTASAPGVSDAVARCEARTSEAQRRRCRAELARQGQLGQRR